MRSYLLNTVALPNDFIKDLPLWYDPKSLFGDLGSKLETATSQRERSIRLPKPKWAMEADEHGTLQMPWQIPDDLRREIEQGRKEFKIAPPRTPALALFPPAKAEFDEDGYRYPQNECDQLAMAPIEI